MRYRLTEFLPLLLACVVLIVFQLSRMEAPGLPFQPLVEPTPTVVSVESSVRRPTQTPRVAVPTPGVCSGAAPRFVRGMANLKTALGTIMGDAVECERVVNVDGDTQQRTTTGLAYYRKQLNTACFTTGWEHWGLVERGLVEWAGSTVDPPAEAVVIPTPRS